MAVFLHNNDLTIELYDDSSFYPSLDSPTTYVKTIQAVNDKPYTPTSQHAIKISKEDKILNTAIILATGGETGIHEGAALTDEGNLVIRCCNKLFSLSLPDLEINWIKEVDWATCFSVHKYRHTYITHGETSISRIDRAGKLLWSFSGSDIFVRLYEGEPFLMQEQYIDLTDFNGIKYRIDYNGEVINHEPPTNHRPELNVNTR